MNKIPTIPPSHHPTIHALTRFPHSFLHPATQCGKFFHVFLPLTDPRHGLKKYKTPIFRNNRIIYIGAWPILGFTLLLSK
jgi:hypothetical protein